MTTFGRAGYLRRAMAAGADGFVVKDTPARLLADGPQPPVGRHRQDRRADPAEAIRTAEENGWLLPVGPMITTTSRKLSPHHSIEATTSRTL